MRRWQITTKETDKEKHMISLRKIVKELNDDVDYTTGEIAEMGFKPFSIYNAIKRGHLTGRKVFGKTYINGAELREYFAKGMKIS